MFFFITNSLLILWQFILWSVNVPTRRQFLSCQISVFFQVYSVLPLSSFVRKLSFQNSLRSKGNRVYCIRNSLSCYFFYSTLQNKFYPVIQESLLFSLRMIQSKTLHENERITEGITKTIQHEESCKPCNTTREYYGDVFNLVWSRRETQV